MLIDQQDTTPRSGYAYALRRDPAAARALGDALFLLFSGAVTEAQNLKATWPVDAAKSAALLLCRVAHKSALAA